MKKTLFILIPTIILLASSCRKIIDIKLDDADKRTTIDAKLISGTNDFRIKVTKSGNFFGESTVTPLTDAVVELNDGSSTYNLTHTGIGYYSLPSYTAIDNKTYSLKVTQGGETFNATSVMPKITKIDTLSYEYQAASTFNDEGYVMSIEIQDAPGIENYYRIEMKYNDDSYYGSIEDLILLDDQLLDGNKIVFPIFNAEVAKLGDTVTMYLFSLDKQAYTYFEGIDEVLNGDGAAPANAKSNWNNNALGNFSALAADTMTVVIK